MIEIVNFYGKKHMMIIKSMSKKIIFILTNKLKKRCHPIHIRNASDNSNDEKKNLNQPIQIDAKKTSNSFKN
jgi:hypothetical protein